MNKFFKYFCRKHYLNYALLFAIAVHDIYALGPDKALNNKIVVKKMVIQLPTCIAIPVAIHLK